eukprot:1160769-Pelagomonas_calceolata.AAC.11
MQSIACFGGPSALLVQRISSIRNGLHVSVSLPITSERQQNKGPAVAGHVHLTLVVTCTLLVVSYGLAAWCVHGPLVMGIIPCFSSKHVLVFVVLLPPEFQATEPPQELSRPQHKTRTLSNEPSTIDCGKVDHTTSQGAMPL